MQFIVRVRDEALAVITQTRAKLAKARGGVAEFTYAVYARAESSVGAVVGRAAGHAKRVLGALTQTQLAAQTRLQQATASAAGVVETAKELKDKAYEDVKTRGLRTCASEAVESARQVAGETAAAAKSAAKASAEGARKRAGQAAATATVKAQELKVATGEVVARPDVQATAGAAAVGTVTGGAAGAATGAVAGAAVGGAVGVPLALFTFGMSIPIGAVLGAGAGAVVGIGGGAAFGLVAGGAAGYGAYNKKDEIRGAGANVLGKAADGAAFVKGQALTRVGYARDFVSTVRTRLTGGRAGTGGTAGTMD